MKTKIISLFFSSVILCSNLNAGTNFSFEYNIEEQMKIAKENYPKIKTKQTEQEYIQEQLFLTKETTLFKLINEKIPLSPNNTKFGLYNAIMLSNQINLKTKSNFNGEMKLKYESVIKKIKDNDYRKERIKNFLALTEKDLLTQSTIDKLLNLDNKSYDEYKLLSYIINKMELFDMFKIMVDTQIQNNIEDRVGFLNVFIENKNIFVDNNVKEYFVKLIEKETNPLIINYLFNNLYLNLNYKEIEEQEPIIKKYLKEYLDNNEYMEDGISFDFIEKHILKTIVN